jgi:hypothetical protein
VKDRSLWFVCRHGAKIERPFWVGKNCGMGCRLDWCGDHGTKYWALYQTAYRLRARRNREGK